MVELIHRLQHRGIEVEVLAPAYRGLASQVLDGVRVHRFRYAPRQLETLTHDQTAPDRVRERPWYLALVPGYVLAGALAASRLARTGRFDVIHAFWPVPHGLMGLVAKRTSGVPLVCTFFGVELTWLQSQLPFLGPLLRRIARGSDAVTAISRYTAARLRHAWPNGDVVVIPFGAAATGTPAAVPPLPSARPAGIHLLFVGRLVRRKGVDVLLQAMALLPDEVSLRVVGDGPCRVDLERSARAMGLGYRVRFDGGIPDDALASRFDECDILVLPAVTDAKGDTEGLGVVLIEALTYGKPVIASDIGGIPDIVRNEETGLLVNPGDADALAAAISRMAADPSLRERLVANGRAHIERYFSWDAIVRDLSRLYDGVRPAARL